MAVAVDSVVPAQSGINTTGVSFAFNNVAGNMIVVGYGSVTKSDPTTLTYAGTALTKIGSQDNTSNRTQLWFLAAPATGSNTMIVGKASDSWVLGGVSFSGSATSMSTGDFNFTSATATSTAPSITITSTTGEFVIDALFTPRAAGSTITASTGQTEQWNVNLSNQYDGAGSTKTGAASVTMSWALSTKSNWAYAGVRVKATGAAAAGSVVTPRCLALLGVGA